MLSKLTLFVLGAGANVPYGFSTGMGLLEKARAREPMAIMGNAGNQLTQAECSEFRTALDNNMLPSIDAMLEHRQDLWKVGKRVMAALLYAEEAKAVPPPVSDDWMSLIFESMADRANSLADFGRNPVSFITFNYDRYLERRFVRALTARYNCDAKTAWAAMKAISFIHLHGSLGILPEQVDSKTDSGSSIDLGAPDSPGIYTLGLAFPVIEKLLRIIHDPYPTELYNNVQALFSVADQIVFLGFGFGRTNVERLGTRHIPQSTPIWCTAYDMTTSEIEHLIEPAFPGRPNFGNPHAGYVGVAPIRRFFRERMKLLY